MTSLQQFFSKNGRDIVSIELKCISKQYIENSDQFLTGFSAQFRDEFDLTECVFLNSIIKSSDKIKEQYEIIQPQCKYSIENIVPFGKLSHQNKLKVIPETKFTLLSQPDIRFNFDRVIQQKYLGPEELDLMGVVKRVSVHRNRKVLHLIVGEIGKYQEVDLNLWDQFVNLEIEPFFVIMAEKLLFKKYNEQNELNTTKQKSKIITNKDQVPLYLINSWENTQTLKRQLIQEDIQHDILNLQLKKIDPCRPLEKYNIVCKILQIGPTMSLKDVKIAEAIIFEAVNNQQYQISLFGNLIKQVVVDHEYFITNVTKSQRQQNELKTWSNQTRIIDLGEINIMNEEISYLRTQINKRDIPKSSLEKQIIQVVQPKQPIDLPKQLIHLPNQRPCLLNIWENFQNENYQNHSYTTRAHIMQIKANRFETKCSRCFKVTESCQACQTTLNVQTLVFGTISDFSQSLEVTFRESNLFRFLSNFYRKKNV